MLNFPPWQRWLVIAICLIGVAPTKPAEFVIFRLSQRSGG